MTNDDYAKKKEYDLLTYLVRDFNIHEYTVSPRKFLHHNNTDLHAMDIADYQMRNYQITVETDDVVSLKIPLSKIKELAKLYEMVDKKRMSAAARQAFEEFMLLQSLSR